MGNAVSLYIGRKEVIACLVSDKGPQLVKFAVEPIREDSGPGEKGKKSSGKVQAVLSPLSRSISRALKKIGTPKARLNLTISPSYLITRFFRMPLVPTQEMQNAVRFEGSRYIPFKVEETVSDFVTRVTPLPGEPDKKGLAVTYSAVRSDVIRGYLNQIRSAASKIEYVEPFFSGLCRTLVLQDKTITASTFGLIFFDDHIGVNISLISEGMVYISHDFELTDEDPEINQAHFYQELKSSLEYFGREAGEKRIGKIYLSGYGELESWRDFLGRIFKQGMTFELAGFATKNPEIEARKALLAVPFGLALRSFKSKSPMGDLQLIPPAEQKTEVENFKQWVGIEFVVVAILFMLVRLVGFESYYQMKMKQVMQESSKAMKDPSLTGLSLDSVTKQKEAVKSEVMILRKFTKDRIALSEKFKTCFKLKPAAVWLDSMNYAGGYADRKSMGKSTLPGAAGKVFFQNKLTVEGACFMGNSEKEVQAINGWVKKMSEDKKFMEGFKKITVSEMKRSRFLNQDVTSYQVQVE